MAQVYEARTGEKRGPTRPQRATSSMLAAKRQKTAAPTPSSYATPTTPSPAVGSPVPERKAYRLPAKVADNKPLPSLPEPQALRLSTGEFQSIAASAVLSVSLERSRLKWIQDGIFDKYWVKPELGKNAKPPPPGNPDGKWMKPRGQCRVRIEPHIFEADVFIEEKVKLPPAPKQYQSTFGQPYRPPQGQQPYIHQQNPQSQNRPTPPGCQLGPPQAVRNGHAASPMQATGAPQAPAPRVQPSPTPAAASSPAPAIAQQQDRKGGPDPVISMLASRASSDIELKGLMKEVATGNASQDQLKIFQRHIDELTAIIQKQKKDEEEKAAKEEDHSNVIQYDGAADATLSRLPPAPHPQQQPSQQRQQPYATPQPLPPVYHQQQPAWTPPPPSTNLPVILEFTTIGAITDRWLFPQHSILEPLSPQHTLASFLVIRKGRQAADPTGLELDKEYWQAITMMVEVAYGREEILHCIRRWVKPEEESRKYMESAMQRCPRAPQTYLPLRLPYKGSAVPESEELSKEATPTIEERATAKTSAKHVKKVVSTPKGTATPPISTARKLVEVATGDATSAANGTPSTAAENAVTAPVATDGSSENPEASETGRPRRAVRKSVRISEG